MNVCTKINEAFWGGLSYTKCKIAQCFDKPRRRPEIHVTSGMSRPGPRHVRLERLRKLMESDELEISHINGALQGWARDPVTMVRDVIYFSGYLDPQLKYIGTDLKNNLSPYIKNPNCMRCKSFAGDAFRSSSIEKCALNAIRWLNTIYRDSPLDEVHINIIGHSMGARIAERVAQILHEMPELGEKKYVIRKIISLNGANGGSPAAVIAGGLICFTDNIGKNLRPSEVQEEDQHYKKLKSRAIYLAVENDPVIPPDYAAPPNTPVLVLRDVSRMSPHTAILNDPVAKYLLIKNLAS